MYFAGSDQEWSRQLDQLEKKGFYENTCGDLMLSALAHNFCVDIFVINTSRGSTPFSPISSSVWGGKQTNKPPLLLVYDGVHFEPLLPATPHDCQLTIELMQRWKAGNFNVTLAGLKTRQGSHSAEQKMMPFEQVSTDRVESAASAVAMQVKNEQTWTTVEKVGKKKKAEFVQEKVSAELAPQPEPKGTRLPKTGTKAGPKVSQTKRKKMVFGASVVDSIQIDDRVLARIVPHPKIYTCIRKSGTTSSDDPARTKMANLKRAATERRVKQAHKLKQESRERQRFLHQTERKKPKGANKPTPLPLHGWLLTTCPLHPKAAHLDDFRACTYCLQIHWCGRLHKQFSSNIEGVYTFKNEEAGSDAGVTQVFFNLKISSN